MSPQTPKVPREEVRETPTPMPPRTIPPKGEGIVPIAASALTEECKRYIAKYLGESPEANKYCFTDTTATTVRYWTVTDEEKWGSTLDAVTMIVKFEGYSYEDKINKIGKIDAAKLAEKNGGIPLTDSDLEWIRNNSNAPNKFCYTEVATPTPTVTPTPSPTPKLPPWQPVSPEECPPKERGYHCLTIESEPSGASIYIDGEDTYRLTPETFKIVEGVHDIKLTKAGYADYETSITVFSEKRVKYTLTKVTPTPVPPIEIEVRKGELMGYVDIGASRIPRSITVGTKYTYRIRVENPEEGVAAVYKVTLEFIGTGDVAGKKFSFSSEWSDVVDPGDGISLYVDVLMPSYALADTTATYELWVTLEGEKATVAAGV